MQADFCAGRRQDSHSKPRAIGHYAVGRQKEAELPAALSVGHRYFDAPLAAPKGYRLKHSVEYNYASILQYPGCFRIACVRLLG